jgi:hypothetical protein
LKPCGNMESYLIHEMTRERLEAVAMSHL